MRSLKKQELIDLMKEVQLAPSAHNTQPFHWSWTGEMFLAEPLESRQLPIADAKNKDFNLSFGAQVEGLSIALKHRGFDIDQNDQCGVTRSVAIKELSSREDDPLYPYVSTRRTYRGPFSKASSEQINALTQAFVANPNVGLIFDRVQMKTIAKFYDEATELFFKKPGYLVELNHWLRFNKKDPQWFEDGLNQEAMSLNGIESFFAKRILQPQAYSVLDRIGLGKILISEVSKNMSATALFCLLGQEDEEDVPLGRKFYRTWLEVEKLGLSLCPLSNLVDHPDINQKLQAFLPYPNKRKILKIFRIGPKPKEKSLPQVFRRRIDDFFTIEREGKIL